MTRGMPDKAAVVGVEPAATTDADEAPGAELDRRIVLATQGGLPLVPRPYAAVAETSGVAEGLVRERLAAMLADGRIRRIGAVPNHYAIGYTANGMSVWDVDDSVIDAVGERVGGSTSSPTATAARATCPTGPTTCSRWCTPPAARPRSSVWTRSPR
jgi:hypothetical protein